MKKFLTITLTVVYLVLMSGITLQLHYCGGKLASIKLALIEKSHTCACGSKAMKKGCCKNQSVYVKVPGDQKFSNNIVCSFNNVQDAVLTSPALKASISETQYAVNITNYHAPPPRYSNSLLIFHNTFRI